MCKLARMRATTTCATVLALATVLAGCGDDLYEPRYVSSLSEAASFHVSDDAVILYSKIKGDLRPAFKLATVGRDGKPALSPGDAALSQVLPTTGYYEQQVIQALSAALAVRLPTTAAKEETKTEQKDEKTTVTVINTSTYETGKPPTVDELKGTKQGKDERAMTPISPLLTNDEKRKLDTASPLLRYNLAAALVQEVAMLNKALDFIESETSKSHDTYILRLRVALQPLAPNQPYNAYVSLSFSCVPKRAGSDSPNYYAPPAPNQAPVKIHPLLVTDDLETTSTARSAQLITQLSFAITGMLGPAGFGGLFNSDRSKIRTLLGKDLNSTFSISRTADNAVSVRLGAPRQPTAGYAMINRNHAVSVVLQVPKENCPFVNVAFAGSLRDANTGVLVPDPLQPILDANRAAFRRLLAAYVKDRAKFDAAIARISDLWFRELTDKVQATDYYGFYGLLNEELRKLKAENGIIDQAPGAIRNEQCQPNECLTASIWRSLWGKLAEVRSLSPYQNVSITLPAVGEPVGGGAGPTRRGTSQQTGSRDAGQGPTRAGPGPTIINPESR
jgi:hypothetical protein